MAATILRKRCFEVLEDDAMVTADGVASFPPEWRNRGRITIAKPRLPSRPAGLSSFRVAETVYPRLLEPGPAEQADRASGGFGEGLGPIRNGPPLISSQIMETGCVSGLASWIDLEARTMPPARPLAT